MRYYTQSLLFLLLSFIAFPQQPEPLLLTVDYTFTHIHDTTDRSHPLTEPMSLYVAANSSSYHRSPQSAPPPATGSDAGAAPAPVKVVSGGPMAVVYAPGYTDYELCQYPAKDQLLSITTLGINQYVTETKLPAIEWQIGQETKVIGDYTCQQATGTYAGRTYLAWFTTELPFRNGPWKLSGLPGLILEAADASGDIRFSFLSIRQGQPGQQHRWGRDRFIPASAAALAKAKEAFEENPLATLQAQLPQGTRPARLAYRDISGRFTTGDAAQPLIDQKRKTAKHFINNPIER